MTAFAICTLHSALVETFMPIRFRCAYCSQLMGIARRKAGTVVSCPTCHGQVVVPDPGPGGDDEPAQQPDDAAPPPLFERSDFDQVFAPAPHVPAPPRGQAPAGLAPGPVPPPPPSASAKPWGAAQREIAVDVEQTNAPLPNEVRAGQTGVWLSPTAMTLLCLLVLVLLALSFVAGLLVGRSLAG
jgi:hypothetical protein